MSQVSVEHTVDAPVNEVWAALADFGGIHRFHPGVERSPIINGQATGRGAQRTCHFYQGMEVTEEIVAFEDGESMTVGVAEAPMPVNDMRVVFAVKAVGAKATMVTIEMDYRPKLGPLGALMNAVVMRSKIRGMLGKILVGLAQHVETGALIGRGGIAHMPPAA